ncbi:hypothetical protein H8D83_01985, partial [Candidatus Woesearchaeota archaeon]|nr:hypothetical protein [Candidatus Woesearchaeota archaeon]
MHENTPQQTNNTDGHLRERTDKIPKVEYHITDKFTLAIRVGGRAIAFEISLTSFRKPCA